MILVTGSTGHIGNVLVRKLMERGENIRCLVLPQDDLTPLVGMDVEIVLGNVLDSTSLERAMDGVSDVFHLAGMISIMPEKDELVHKVNVEGTRNMLQAAEKAGIKRLVYTSSIHALNRVPHGVVIDEKVPFDPVNAISSYDQSKAEASLLVKEAASNGLNAILACPTGVVGPYDYKGSEIGQVILDSMNNGLNLYLDGAYDFVDVRDVAEGLILAWEKGKTGETYILSGEQITVERIVNFVKESIGQKPARLKVPMALAKFAARFTPTYYRWFSKTPRFTPYSLETLESNSVISNRKASEELGFKPRRLQESIRDSILWFKENRHLISSNS